MQSIYAGQHLGLQTGSHFLTGSHLGLQTGSQTFGGSHFTGGCHTGLHFLTPSKFPSGPRAVATPVTPTAT